MLDEIFYKLVCLFKEPVSEKCTLHQTSLLRGLAKEWITGDQGPQSIEVLPVLFFYPFANSFKCVGCTPTPTRKLHPVTYCSVCRETEKIWRKKRFKEKLDRCREFVEEQADELSDYVIEPGDDLIDSLYYWYFGNTGLTKGQAIRLLEIAPEAHKNRQQALRQHYGNSIMRFFCSELEDKS